MSLLWFFFRYKSKFLKHIKSCPGRPIVYDFSTVAGDLEATTGYISEIEGGLMFATSYCLTFNFHSKLEMMSITCLRSFGQNEQELKFITIPQKFWPYIDYDDLLCFKNGCDVVLEKKKQAISTLW